MEKILTIDGGVMDIFWKGTLFYVYVMVHFYGWFKFIFLCFKFIIIHHHTMEALKGHLSLT